jgi:hypothetical protein
MQPEGKRNDQPVIPDKQWINDVLERRAGFHQLADRLGRH